MQHCKNVSCQSHNCVITQHRIVFCSREEEKTDHLLFTSLDGLKTNKKETKAQLLNDNFELKRYNQI